MKLVVGVGFEIPSYDDDYLSFGSKSSLSDADIVIFDSNIHSVDNYRLDSGFPRYKGQSLYSKDSSFSIREDQQHWKHEIKECLKTGKTVFVLLSSKQDFFIHTGDQATSGTGKNQARTDIVNPYSNYEFLPISNISIKNSAGSKIFSRDNIAKNLYENFKDLFESESYIDVPMPSSRILFSSKNQDKTLGLSVNISGGFIVFLPYISFYDFQDENGEWTEEALKLGKKFKANLIEISKQLTSDVQKTVPPEWVISSAFELEGEKRVKGLIDTAQRKIEKLNIEIEKHNDVLRKEESLKDLLFESGKALECAVINALHILGYQAENYDDGNLELDQIIISPEKERFIGECEGKDNRDIDISKFRQLLDSLNEDFSREDISEKAYGILFGNPQRLIEPSQRNLDFTEKCVRGAQREQIALVKTSDLFTITKYLSENDDEEFKRICRNAIKDQLGKIVQFPEIPKKPI